MAIAARVTTQYAEVITNKLTSDGLRVGTQYAEVITNKLTSDGLRMSNQFVEVLVDVTPTLVSPNPIRANSIVIIG